MKKQEVIITIKKDGSFSFEAGEGIKGMNCREVTRELELALGGVATSTKNKSSYYEGDDDMDINIDLN